MRPMNTSELPIFYQWATQSDSAPFWYGELYSTHVPTYEEFTRDWKRYYFDGSEPEKGRCFVILVGNRVIGQVNYNEINRDNNSVELDIIIAKDTDKNKGYGTDALKILTNHLFQNMNVQSCVIEHVTRNPRAIRASEKAGFKTTKTFVRNEIEWNHMELKSQ